MSARAELYLGAILFGIGIVADVVVGSYFKFSNPDMTSTRLLLTYWQQYLPALALTIIGCALLLHATWREDHS